MKSKGTLRRVLLYLRPYRLTVILSFLFSAASVALTLYVPVLIGRVIDLIVGPGNVNWNAMWPLMVKIAVAAGGAALLQWIVSSVNNRITFAVVKDIRNEAFRKLQELPLAYLDTKPQGELVSRIIADADQFADGLLMGFTQLFTGIVTILGTLVFMLSIQPGITLVVVLLTPVSFLVARFIACHTYSMFRLQSETRGEQTALTEEMISNRKVVKAFGHEQAAMAQFDEINDRLEKCSLRAVFYSSLTNPCTRFVNSLVYAGVALAGALVCISTAGGAAAFSVGSLSALLAYANQYTKPFNEISGVVTELQNALACAQRIFDLLEEPSQVPEVPDADVLTGVAGNVRAEDVFFSYTPDRPLIRNFCLDVKPGQKIAIVGPTGCGKTTVINLLMRFYDVNAGAVLVEGKDVRAVTRSSLRASWGMVLQETWLKNATVRENIAMGKPDATQEEVENAAKEAFAHSFILRLPKGYDTVIDEDSLSQGQKQLLCIARVMLCLPPMLILDEATSSIDTRTEVKIQQAFARMMEGRTTFLVAHRLSTIREADCILVMRDGNVIEKGRHNELLAQNGFYAHLYNSQFEQA